MKQSMFSQRALAMIAMIVHSLDRLINQLLFGSRMFGQQTNTRGGAYNNTAYNRSTFHTSTYHIIKETFFM